MWTFALITVSLLAFGTAEAYNGTLVSFGELSLLDIEDSYKLRDIHSLQEDVQNPGGFIVGNQHSLTVITPDLRAIILAGKENATGYREGVGPEATFETVLDVTQYNNGDDILVADNGNRCIRTVNRVTQRTQPFAGKCDFGGTFQGTVSASNASIPQPDSLLYDEKRNRLFYLTYNPSSIIEHDLSADELTLRYQNIAELTGTWSFVADTNFSYLYVAHEGGISKISTKDWSKTLVAGLSRWEYGDSKDGPLLEARFGVLARMVWLIQDQVLLVGEYFRHSLRVINLEDGLVTTLCKGRERHNPTYILGGPETCQMNLPQGMAVSNGSVYIGDILGQDGRTPGRQGAILKLEYHQPICFPPPSNSLSCRYEPVQEYYTHKQTTKFTCNRGFVLDSTYNTLTCIRAMHENGTVYGKWDPPIIPECKLLGRTEDSANRRNRSRVYYRSNGAARQGWRNSPMNG